MDGLSGPIRFDSLGFRSDFNLDIVELKKEGLAKVGVWNRGAGANFTRNFTEAYSDIIESLHNKTLVVTTILVSVYCADGMKSEIVSLRRTILRAFYVADQARAQPGLAIPGPGNR